MPPYSYEYIDDFHSDYQIIYLKLNLCSSVIEHKLCSSKLENKYTGIHNKKEKNASYDNMPFMKSFVSGTKFVHKHPLDENGILYYFGTNGTRENGFYQNPAELGMVIVNSSQLMPDSEASAAFIGRECVRCVTRPSASCWFSIDFIDKYIKPSHYTLRHYMSWDTECLRNWVIEG
eukprot:232213_1